MDIAYQVFGDGPVDLLVLSGPSIPIDSVDAEPSMYRFHRRLASFSRVIRFDPRGLGLSSRVPSAGMIGPILGAGRDRGDGRRRIRAGDDLCAEFHRDDRTGTRCQSPPAGEKPRDRRWCRRMVCADYPVGVDLGLADPFMTVGLEPDAVEKGFDALEIVAPTVSGDEAFRTWWDLAGNRAASPTMARAVTKMVAEADVRDTLANIVVPTLIVHRDQAIFVAVGHGRYLAEHIAGLAMSSCLGGTLCIGPATQRLCSTRSRSSSPACAASRPNVYSPQSFSPISSAQPNARPRSVTTGGTPCSTTMTVWSATSSNDFAVAK